MPDSKIYDVIVIGSGGAGQMAVLRSVLNHLDTLIFLGDPTTTRKSRATWVSEVENIPGMFDLKRPISSTTRNTLKFIETHEDLKRFFTSIRKAVTSIKKENDLFIISDGENEYISKYVVLCTGTMDIQPEINGSIEPVFPYANREDILYCIRCDGHKVVGEPTSVIGHKGAAGWIAVMLRERYDIEKLYVLTHGKPFEGDDEIKELLNRYSIEVIEDEIEEILGDPKKSLEGFKCGNRDIHVTRSFVALGSIVYNELAKSLGAEINHRDHLITSEKGETTIPGFYAAGDLVAGKKKQVYTAWDMAVDAVDDIDLKIRLEKRNKVLSS